MSTIKSSNEHLTLNADGSGKDIKFQSNGSEVASISDGGVVTATTFTGAATDATKLPLAGGTLTGNTTIATNSVPTLALKRTGNNAGNGYIECHGADDSVDYAIRFAQTNGVMSFDNGGSRIMGVTADGLTFGSDTAAANALDDYEEGSFTPVFTGSSGSAGSYNTGEHEARYTKIGRLVVIQFKLTLTHAGSWGGEVRFTGLPFSVSDTMPATGSVTLAYVDVPGDASNHNVYVTSGVTYWRVQYTTDNNATSMVLLSETANNASFAGTFSYTTNA